MELIELQNLCRTCMVESVNMRSLFNTHCGDKTLCEALEFVTNIKIKEEDILPKQICNDCEAILAQSELFKRRCIYVEERLCKLLNSSANRLEISVKCENVTESSSEQCPCSACPIKFSKSEEFTSHVFYDHQNALKKEDLIEVSDLNDSNAKSNVKEELNTNELAGDELSSHYEDFTVEDTLQDNHNDILEGNKSNSKVYNCPSCSSTFDNKSELREHLQDVHFEYVQKEPKTKKRKKTVAEENPDITYYCVKCNVRFKNLKSLRNHNWKKHDYQLEPKKSKYDGKFRRAPDGTRLKYECALCLSKFVKKTTLIRHLKRHDKPSSYNCALCKREFVHKAHLESHILKIHSTKMEGFKCSKCVQKYFPTQESLKLHNEIQHTVEKMHECKLCSKAFHMSSTLKDHLRVHTGEKPFLCPLCGKGFSQNTNLTEHLRRHQGIKPFKCTLCDRRFVSKGELAAHTRKHSGAHPFICVDCGNGFTTSSSLVKHRRTHTGEKPYACDLCHMKFAASGTLKNHRRTHTGEKPYKCQHCDKAFVQKNDLTAHTRCHTGERPYVCPTCGQAFRQGSALKTHFKMHAAKSTDAILHPSRNLLQGLVSSVPTAVAHSSTV